MRVPAPLAGKNPAFHICPEASFVTLVGQFQERFHPNVEDYQVMVDALGYPKADLLQEELSGLARCPPSLRNAGGIVEELEIGAFVKYGAAFSKITFAMMELRRPWADQMPRGDPYHYDELSVRGIEACVLEDLSRRDVNDTLIRKAHCVPLRWTGSAVRMPRGSSPEDCIESFGILIATIEQMKAAYLTVCEEARVEPTVPITERFSIYTKRFEFLREGLQITEKPKEVNGVKILPATATGEGGTARLRPLQ